MSENFEQYEYRVSHWSDRWYERTIQRINAQPLVIVPPPEWVRRYNDCGGVTFDSTDISDTRAWVLHQEDE